MRRVLSLLFLVFYSLNSYADFPHPWQINFQRPATELMENIEWLHEFLMIIMSGVVVVVMFLIAFVCIRYNAKANPVPSKFTHNVLIEVIWTIIPVILLVIIAVPSFRILYYAEHPPKADMTLKVVGYQWYWHYIYPDNGNLEFDSYMKDTKDLQPGEMRLLEVDNRVVLPAGKVIRIITTGADVIHSFAVPSFGIKIDTIPGKMNETWIKVNEPGVYYGQCSELCGVNHGFMPIAVEIVTEEQFAKWVDAAKEKFK